jgi:hypothetical protein
VHVVDGRRLRRTGLVLGIVMVVVLSAVTALVVSHRQRSADPIVAAAGDIACDPTNRYYADGAGTANACRQQAVSDLLVDAGLAGVLTLGDNQYQCGGRQAYLDSYDRSWGRVKDITHPVPGNHEYLPNKGRADARGGTTCDATARAGGYFDYFGSAAGDPTKGYYSFDIGAWHVVGLNSSCTPRRACDDTSRQIGWLRKDLAKHPNACVLAFWHQPRFSSGDHGADPVYGAFWNTLYAAGVDVVLNGHDHIYERFAPQTPTAAPDVEHGIRQFTVGTGGANHRKVHSAAANSEARNDATFGVLKLTLRSDKYDWEFVPVAGGTFRDSGSGSCHEPPG